MCCILKNLIIFQMKNLVSHYFKLYIVEFFSNRMRIQKNLIIKLVFLYVYKRYLTGEYNSYILTYSVYIIKI